MTYNIFSVFAVLSCSAMATVFILEKHIRRQFFEYTYKVKLANFQLRSFRRSAVTNENSLGGNLPPPSGKVGLNNLSVKTDTTFRD